MNEKIIAWDLGTGGNKASLYSKEGVCLAKTYVSYKTTYQEVGWHEQRPEDWWQAVVKSTKNLLKESKVDKEEIVACGISGHSLGAVLISEEGKVLNESAPIWSDGRAHKESDAFFKRYSWDKWYLTTGNGFNPAFYTAFKLMWYRNNVPEAFYKTKKVIGTKDYINFRMTGRLCTDPSYASGSGVWDLKKWDYSDELIEMMGFDKDIFPEVIPSTGLVGKIKEDVAEELGLSKNLKVISGGVDNSCMALGAMAYKEGRVYNSLGSSSWVAVSSKEPLLDTSLAPYVFTHVVPGYFASALCINAGGTAFRWTRDTFCKDLKERAEAEDKDVYDLMTEEAEGSPIGANGLIFNPSLGGGAPMDKSVNLRGAYIGLDLIHDRSDILRASMEGISMGLRRCLDGLRSITKVGDEMLLVGGGSKSGFWRQIYADIYHSTVLKSNIDEQAAALGAAACAAVGVGLWDDFDKIDELHVIEESAEPIRENVEFYDKLMVKFNKIQDHLCDIGDFQI